MIFADIVPDLLRLPSGTGSYVVICECSGIDTAVEVSLTDPGGIVLGRAASGGQRWL